MKQVSFKMKLIPGFEEEYERRHDQIWPELVTLLRDTGIHHYSIFLDAKSDTLFAVMQIEDPARLHDLPAHPVMQRWWAYMGDIMETNADHSPVMVTLKTVFTLPPRAPEETMNLV